jgi:hypothetical protein
MEQVEVVVALTTSFEKCHKPSGKESSQHSPNIKEMFYIYTTVSSLGLL